MVEQNKELSSSMSLYNSPSYLKLIYSPNRHKEHLDVNNGNRVFDTHLRDMYKSDALWILGQVSEPNYNVKTLNSEV